MEEKILVSPLPTTKQKRKHATLPLGSQELALARAREAGESIENDPRCAATGTDPLMPGTFNNIK